MLAKYRAPIRSDESLQGVPITECTLAEYVDYCFAVVSSRYRLRYGMKFYEFEFLSTHYHLVGHRP